MSYNLSNSGFKVGAADPYVVGGVDVALADGGTGASDAAGARTNLGLVIGTDVQAYDADLAAIAGLVSAADKLPYFTGSGTAGVADFTAAGRALMDDVDAPAQRTTLGLGSIATQASNSISVTGGTMANVAISGLANPSASGDAANKGYVDSVASGLDVKQSVRVAVTGPIGSANFTYNNGSSGVGATITSNVNEAIGNIDGVAVSVGNRILLGSVAGSADLKVGIYTVTDAGSGSTPWILTRATDFDQAAEVSGGAFTFVEEGTNLADAGFVLSTDGAITIGTTAMLFSQFSGAGAINAGNGLVKTGNTLDVNFGDGVEIVSDQVKVKLNGSTLFKDGAGVKVATGGITGNELANNSVDAAKIVDGSVGSAELANEAVTFAKMARIPTAASFVIGQGSGADVGAFQLTGDVTATSNGTVTIANNAVTQAKLASNSVGSAQIIDGNVGTNELANNAVTPAKADLSLGWVHAGALTANGGMFMKTVVSNVDFTFGATETVVLITDTAAQRTVTLPALSGNTGRILIIKDASGAAATNNITIDGNGAETIDGTATKVINANYGSLTLVGDVGGWSIL